MDEVRVKSEDECTSGSERSTGDRSREKSADDSRSVKRTKNTTGVTGSSASASPDIKRIEDHKPATKAREEKKHRRFPSQDEAQGIFMKNIHETVAAKKKRRKSARLASGSLSPLTASPPTPHCTTPSQSSPHLSQRPKKHQPLQPLSSLPALDFSPVINKKSSTTTSTTSTSTKSKKEESDSETPRSRKSNKYLRDEMGHSPSLTREESLSTQDTPRGSKSHTNDESAAATPRLESRRAREEVKSPKSARADGSLSARGDGSLSARGEDVGHRSVPTTYSSPRKRLKDRRSASNKDTTENKDTKFRNKESCSTPIEEEGKVGGGSGSDEEKPAEAVGNNTELVPKKETSPEIPAALPINTKLLIEKFRNSGGRASCLSICYEGRTLSKDQLAPLAELEPEGFGFTVSNSESVSNEDLDESTSESSSGDSDEEEVEDEELRVKKSRNIRNKFVKASAKPVALVGSGVMRNAKLRKHSKKRSSSSSSYSKSPGPSRRIFTNKKSPQYQSRGRIVNVTDNNDDDDGELNSGSVDDINNTVNTGNSNKRVAKAKSNSIAAQPSSSMSPEVSGDSSSSTNLAIMKVHKNLFASQKRDDDAEDDAETAQHQQMSDLEEETENSGDGTVSYNSHDPETINNIPPSANNGLTGVSIVPALLPARIPQEMFQWLKSMWPEFPQDVSADTHQLHRSYTFTFIPKGLFSRFIVRALKLFKLVALWGQGILATTRDGTQTILVEHFLDEYISSQKSMAFPNLTLFFL